MPVVFIGTITYRLFQMSKCAKCDSTHPTRWAMLCDKCAIDICVKCGRPHPTAAGLICSACSDGRCMVCGSYKTTRVARICETCATGKRHTYRIPVLSRRSY